MPVEAESFSGAQQIVCGQNCTFVIQANGTVLACGEGSYGRLGQGNSDDLHSLSIISSLQGGLFCVMWSAMYKKFCYCSRCDYEGCAILLF